jgi:hypothetical protein
MKQAIAIAPSGWEVLQFNVNNRAAQAQLDIIIEPFVRWMPEYYSTACVLLSAAGATRLAAKPVLDHGVADFWAFYDMASFTHTGNWFDTVLFADRLNKEMDTRGGSHHAPGDSVMQKLWPPSPEISAIAITAGFGSPASMLRAEQLNSTSPFHVVYCSVHQINHFLSFQS